LADTNANPVQNRKKRYSSADIKDNLTLENLEHLKKLGGNAKLKVKQHIQDKLNDRFIELNEKQ
jgi:hypothetical protein